MIFIRKNPFILFCILLIFMAIACQISTPTPQIAEINTEAIVQQTVATVEARLPDFESLENPEITGLSDPPSNQIDLNLQDVLIDVYKRINPAVVHIFVSSNSFNISLGTGSGFLYDDQGHIITNNHVVTDGDRFEVVFYDNSRSPATLVGTDVDSDLAVIRVESIPSGIEPIPLSDSSLLEVGQFVIAIGNPFGETGSMTIGIISGLGRTLDSQRAIEGGGRYSLPQVIQTDAAINPGNSGGPLLNLQGEVIGVNSAIILRGGTNSGVGFSIPINAVKRIAPSLIVDGKYIYPYIGISMASSLDLETLVDLNLPSTDGVYVTNVVPNTPADAAGLIGNAGSGGDLIIAIDGQSIKDSSELISYLVFETEVGQTIDLTVIRNNNKITIPLKLGTRP